MSVPESVKQCLAFVSDNRCALCNAKLYTETSTKSNHIGEVAHIQGKKKGSARYNDVMTEAERDSMDNLIYLCCNCHTMIDKTESQNYSTERLMLIKKEQIKKQEARHLAEDDAISFAALDTAANWIKQDGALCGSLVDNMTALKISQKIEKNCLSEQTERCVKFCLAHVKKVEEFIASEAMRDPEFPQKLKFGFKAKYYKLAEMGLKGDEIFARLSNFASDKSDVPSEQNAFLAVLVYLFELCEVFES